MNLFVRDALPEEAILVADLSRQTFYDTFAAQNTPEDMEKFLSEQFTRGRLILEMGRRENQFLLAFLEGEVAGYAKLRDGSKPAELAGTEALELARLYAVAALVGKGVGRKLMEECIDRAGQQGKQALWLGVWERNVRAIDFYTRFGFEKFGEQDFVLGNDVQNDWLMVKRW